MSKVYFIAMIAISAWAWSQEADRPCEKVVYPDFLQLPAAEAIENTPNPDPTGMGARWRRLIQTALRPSPRDFSWYSEYQTWTCRYQQQDQVSWYSFPAEANSSEIVGTLVRGRLLVAPVEDLLKQGMSVTDPKPFLESQLLEAERAYPPHPLPKE
jgi:hypothetical protein